MKKFIFFFITLTLLFLPITSTFAQENIKQGEIVSLSKNQVINSDYFAAGERVDVSGTINGDAYIAGGKVFLNGIINGDLLVAGGDVTIRGTVAHDIRVFAGNVTISSTVGGNVTTVAGNVQITDSAKIAGSVVGAGGNIEVYAPIGKGVTLWIGNVTLGNVIKGDFTYWSEDDALMTEGASVSGKIMHNKTNYEKFKGVSDDAFFEFGKILKIFKAITVLILGLVMLFLLPNFVKNAAKNVQNNLWKNMLIGFLSLIAIPMITVILMITIIGIPLGMMLLTGYIFALVVGKIIVAFAVGEKALSYGNIKVPMGVVFIVGLVVFELIGFIPVLGFVFEFLAILVGVGAVLVEKKNAYSLLREKNII